MIKKTIKYTDFDGNERTEDFYFNLTSAEVIDMQLMQNGGLDKIIKKIVDEQDTPKILAIFKELIQKSYGEKSLDGRRFDKSPEKFVEFSQTQAYSELYTSLLTNSDEAAAFVNGIMPPDLRDKMKELENK